ncbi:adhesion G-protein coupled receptor G2-like [Physella acuta]|uniref:adhesion G-protein coupled receptor G2-like n=1 Tax=Physella acuta TaxID=109671 RepID=UPI0027DADC3B|nr:adhesion G-protein coupled receptor G2-like [Physella acuta]
MSTTNSSAISNFRATASLFILLGLTWIFAFCAIGKFRIVFNYLFAIFNSFQGLFIFTFYCMLKQEVVISLKKLCNIKSDDSKAQKPKAGETSTMSTYQEISRVSTDQDSRQLEPKVVRKN